MAEHHENPTGSVGLPEGEKIGKYEVRGRVAIGGQAIVYKGYDELLDRLVAIKQIPSHLAENEKLLARFRREAQILARLGREGSNIVAVYDVIEDSRGLFLVMEYIDGHTLRTILDHQRYAMPMQPALEILWHIASGLRAAHQQNIVHRDIKPANVIVNRQYQAKITDFGVAATAGGEESMTLGTTKYMAPELFEGGAVDVRADIYSLGFIAYEMFTGREYFNNNLFADVLSDPDSANLRWMKWHSDRDKTLPPLAEINVKVPEALSEVVGRMTAKDPDERYRSMDEVLEDLKRVVGGKRRSKSRRAAAPPMNAGRAGQAVEVEDQDQDELALPPEEAEQVDEAPTAEIPKTPEQKKRRIIIYGAAAAAAALVILVVALSLLTVGAREEREATTRYQAALTQYRQGDFQAAAEQFSAIASEYPGLAQGAAARARAKLAQAQLAMLRDELDRAEQLAAEALQADPLLEEDVTKFREDLSIRRDVVEGLAAVDAHMAQRRFDQAAEVVEQLRSQRSVLPPALQDRLERKSRQLADARRQAQYEALIDQGRRAMQRGDFASAESNFESARRLEATEEVRRLEDQLQQMRSYAGLIAQADRAEQQGDLQRALDLRRQAAQGREVEANQRKIEQLQAELTYQAGFAAEQDGRYDEAVELYEQGLALAPQDPRFAEALSRVRDISQRQALIDQAQEHMARRQYAEAVELLEQAQAIQADAALAETLAEAESQMYLREGDRARRNQQWEQAQAAYEQARSVRPQDDQFNQRVDNRLELVIQERRWYVLLDNARTDLERLDYSGAIRTLNSLEEMAAGLNVPVEQVQGLLVDAKYQRELARGREALQRDDFATAMAYFRLAQDIRDTEEVQGLINQADAGLTEREN